MKKRRDLGACDWMWTNTGDAVLVNVETTRQAETSVQMQDVTDVQSDVTDGQPLRPLVGHRARWRKGWQKHSESGGREVKSILNRRTFEPGEDPEKRSCDILRKHQEVDLAHWSGKAQRRLPQMSCEDNARYWICRTEHPGKMQYRSDAKSSTRS